MRISLFLRQNQKIFIRRWRISLPYLDDKTAVLSVIAGVSIQTIENGLGARPIARSMPNTSATIGKSASGLRGIKRLNDRLKKHILGLLESIGMVKEVEEDDFMQSLPYPAAAQHMSII